MDEFSKKVRRVKPVIRAREMQLDNEALILAAIKKEKTEAMQELKRFQFLYMSGVEQLNTERQSMHRDKLSTLESSVDHVKAEWYRSLKKLREIEQREKAQLAQLLVAERNLKSVEKLRDRYKDQFVEFQKVVEQKEIDSMAIRKFSQRK